MKFRSLLVPAAILLGSQLAQASYVTYTSLPAFQAVAGTTNTTTFEGLVAPGQASGFGSGNAIGGVTITASDFQLYVISSTFQCQGAAACSLGTGDYMEGSVYQQCCGAGTTTFSPGAGVYAFALNYRAYDQQPSLSTDVNGTFNVSVNGGPTFSISSTSISNFLGIVSTTPLTSIAFTPTGGQPNANLYAEFFHFDNMITGTSAGAATPEPATCGLLGGSLLLLGLVRGRLRQVLS